MSNPAEAQFIADHVANLLMSLPVERRGDLVAQLAVVTPYKEQRSEVLAKLKRKLPEDLLALLEVSTVDSFQGREKDIIIISCVRAESASKAHRIGFVSDRRRLNVAITRARLSLWVVGDSRSLDLSPDWRALIDDAIGRGFYRTANPSASASAAGHLAARQTHEPRRSGELEPPRVREFRQRTQRAQIQVEARAKVDQDSSRSSSPPSSTSSTSSTSTSTSSSFSSSASSSSSASLSAAISRGPTAYPPTVGPTARPPSAQSAQLTVSAPSSRSSTPADRTSPVPAAAFDVHAQTRHASTGGGRPITPTLLATTTMSAPASSSSSSAAAAAAVAVAVTASYRPSMFAPPRTSAPNATTSQTASQHLPRAVHGAAPPPPLAQSHYGGDSRGVDGRSSNSSNSSNSSSSSSSSSSPHHSCFNNSRGMTANTHVRVDANGILELQPPPRAPHPGPVAAPQRLLHALAPPRPNA